MGGRRDTGHLTGHGGIWQGVGNGGFSIPYCNSRRGDQLEWNICDFKEFDAILNNPGGIPLVIKH